MLAVRGMRHLNRMLKKRGTTLYIDQIVLQMTYTSSTRCSGVVGSSSTTFHYFLPHLIKFKHRTSYKPNIRKGGKVKQRGMYNLIIIASKGSAGRS
jgi:hypothetical protein